MFRGVSRFGPALVVHTVGETQFFLLEKELLPILKNLLKSENPADTQVIHAFREAQNRFLALSLIFRKLVKAHHEQNTLALVTFLCQLSFSFNFCRN